MYIVKLKLTHNFLKKLIFLLIGLKVITYSKTISINQVN